MKNNKTNNLNIKEVILRKINTKELEMRPKFYFTLKILVTTFLAVFVLLISVFILNFILFSIRINNQDMLLDFGPRGWNAFSHFFPWGLLVLDIILVFILERFVRHFRFGYKVPVLYLLGGIIIITTVVGFAVDRGTGLNEHLLHRADEHRLPSPLKGMYGHARTQFSPGSGVCLCTIETISGNGSILGVKDTKSTTTLQVVIPEAILNAKPMNFQIGDTIFVAGEVKDGVMQAFGVKIPPFGSRKI